MKISATVPTRVDLAGGTLDVYPLYIFERGGLTVNAAVSVEAAAQIETRNDSRIVIRSTDLGLVEEIPSLERMELGGRLDLVKRALSYYRPESGLEITISSQAPAGSGLGASSALLMALSNALNTLTAKGLTYGEIIDIGANIEAQIIGIPTGKQDYFPPTYGGICSMWFDVDGWRFESLSANSDLVATLNERLIVSYTGIPHHSEVTNWAMLKNYIENEGDTVARMSDIKAIAQAMRDCLVAGDMEEFPRLVGAEWQLRRGLAKGVTTPQIDAIMAAAAHAGAQASKICGAGGGGCMITVVPPDSKAQVAAALATAGARIMDAELVSDGLVLEKPIGF